MTLDEMISDIDYVLNKSQLATLELGDESTKQLLHWLEDYKRLQSVSSWIPCSERMPERDGFYLAYYTFADGRHAFDIVYFNVGSPISSSITHWMPLPSMPEVTNNVD